MSGIIRFISDPHFGHLSMAKKRGFPDAYNHDENMVYQWNNVVNKKDTTWILGDITMEKANYEILDRLNGYKRVVLGNHDMGNHAKSTLVNYVNSIHGMVKLRDKKHGVLFLTHCPIHPSELYRAEKNIHGHIHDKFVTTKFNLKDDRYINVCAEVIDYTPKTLNELIK